MKRTFKLILAVFLLCVGFYYFLREPVVPPPQTDNQEVLHQWWVRMSKRDPKFEWKMPIVFYGKIIDDEDSLVEDATINFQWTDISNSGTSESIAFSDRHGLFHLSGVHGKRLVVRVSKKGYALYDVGNRFSFEYAAYFEPEWYVPDANRPVIFKMHKIKKSEPLIFRRNQEAEILVGQKYCFPIGPRGVDVLVERLQNSNEDTRKGWSARVSVPNGGLILLTEEFPVEAPIAGYVDDFVVSQSTPTPAGWQIDNGASFYIKTNQGYGRITVRNTRGNSWVYVTSYFNPNPLSRNLEFDAKKVIKFER